MLDKLDDHGLTVKIKVGAIQDIGLDPALGALEGRVGADRDSGRQLAIRVAAGQLRLNQPAGVDAICRRQGRCGRGNWLANG